MSVPARSKLSLRENCRKRKLEALGNRGGQPSGTADTSTKTSYFKPCSASFTPQPTKSQSNEFRNPTSRPRCANGNKECGNDAADLDLGDWEFDLGIKNQNHNSKPRQSDTDVGIQEIIQSGNPFNTSSGLSFENGIKPQTIVTPKSGNMSCVIVNDDGDDENCEPGVSGGSWCKNVGAKNLPSWKETLRVFVEANNTLESVLSKEGKEASTVKKTKNAMEEFCPESCVVKDDDSITVCGVDSKNASLTGRDPRFDHCLDLTVEGDEMDTVENSGKQKKAKVSEGAVEKGLLKKKHGSKVERNDRLCIDVAKMESRYVGGESSTGRKMADIQPSVQNFLSELKLSKFLPVFNACNVDAQSLLTLTEDGLAQMGVPLGPRKKIVRGVKFLKLCGFATHASKTPPMVSSRVAFTKVDKTWLRKFKGAKANTEPQAPKRSPTEVSAFDVMMHQAQDSNVDCGKPCVFDRTRELNAITNLYLVMERPKNENDKQAGNPVIRIEHANATRGSRHRVSGQDDMWSLHQTATNIKCPLRELDHSVPKSETGQPDVSTAETLGQKYVKLAALKDELRSIENSMDTVKRAIAQVELEIHQAEHDGES